MSIQTCLCSLKYIDLEIVPFKPKKLFAVQIIFNSSVLVGSVFLSSVSKLQSSTAYIATLKHIRLSSHGTYHLILLSVSLQTCLHYFV